jgi:RNA polymerase sigma-70 factor (ECF subfamily)
MPVNGASWCAELYARAAPAARSLARRILRDAPEAEDVVQDSFVAALGLRHRYDRLRGSETSWLLVIVRSKAVDRLRARRVRTSFAATHDGGAVVAVENDPNAVARLNRALSGLPPRQRTALLLAYVEGLTQVEIADRMAAPLGSVKGWVRQGLALVTQSFQLPRPDADAYV